MRQPRQALPRVRSWTTASPLNMKAASSAPTTTARGHADEAAGSASADGRRKQDAAPVAATAMPGMKGHGRGSRPEHLHDALGRKPEIGERWW